MTTITITSFGTGHPDAPWSANPVVVDTKPLRNPPQDPAVRARMTQMTGLDRDVAFYVMTTPGAERLVEDALLAVYDRLVTAPDTDVDVHVSCVGGRHRSVAVSEELASRLRALDAVTADVQVVHRHIDQPILPRLSDRLHETHGRYWVVSHAETGINTRFSEKAVAQMTRQAPDTLADFFTAQFLQIHRAAHTDLPAPLAYSPQEAATMADTLRQLRALFGVPSRHADLADQLAAHADRAAAAGETWTWTKEVSV
ncbi:MULTISPECIES: RNase adapter RapZ [unclassified Streptomyces]|uniref:DUF7739 domain-containing protein n=1 Tax=unclassified Streptomyces TaxID=2593676 RepID=UPI0007F4470C|nr:MULTISPECIES: RNase adapter RapZ [unclassified Streptomyces]AZM64991.1 hypothetical protein DLM49_36435 [Streptomyces sp. WAC 01438]RSM85851.1 hypothetical protein DMA10_36875 [Streptomyces sp. WAC 01420]SBT93983.1 UPF0042 nucleotide-binding protein [Streptomyces sp. DI166]